LLTLAKYRNNWNEVWPEMERLARQALAIDPYDAEAHVVLAFATSSLERLAEAKVAAERAVQLNPSSADILNLAAGSMSYLGEPEQGAAWCDRSFRLNPSPPYWYYLACPENYFFTRRYQDVVDGVDRYGSHAKLNAYQLVYRAASEAELGRREAAAATVSELHRGHPEASFEYFLNTGWVFARGQEEQQILASARKVGVRLCATERELDAFVPPRRLPECVAKPTG
ncbi:MAG TPA: hypothetical protein VFY87_08020, partial [Geminicoccaceae bacterium]|nr:hypothetical protein [Geminicoccaceae bacterium]